MKASAILIYLTFIISNHVLAQNYWIEILEHDENLHCVEISPENTIYVGTKFGVWKSTDNGDTWSFDTISTENITIYSLYICENGVIYAGANNRIFYTENYGQTWVNIFSEVNSNILSLCCNCEGMVLAGSWAGIYKTTDNGSSWGHVLPVYGASAVNSIVDDNNGNYYAGITSFLPAYEYGGVYKSENLGDTWDTIGLYGHDISSLAISTIGDLFAGSGGTTVSFTSGVYLLESGNTNWVEILSDEVISSLCLNSENNIFAGCSNLYLNGGVRFSDDYGATWQVLNTGISYNSNNACISIAPNQHVFTVDIDLEKVYRSVEPTVTNIPAFNEKIINIYPNPFDKEIIISLNQISEEPYWICLYDTYGKIITIRDVTGVKEIIIEVSDLKPGVYFIKIKQMNSNVLFTNKLIKN